MKKSSWANREWLEGESNEELFRGLRADVNFAGWAASYLGKELYRAILESPFGSYSDLPGVLELAAIAFSKDCEFDAEDTISEGLLSSGALDEAGRKLATQVYYGMLEERERQN